MLSPFAPTNQKKYAPERFLECVFLFVYVINLWGKYVVFIKFAQW